MNILQFRLKNSFSRAALASLMTPTTLAVILAAVLVTFSATYSAAGFAADRTSASTRSDGPTPSLPTAPTQKIVLLSSLDLSGVRVPFYLFWKKRYYRNYVYSLEQDFKWFYEGQGYELDIRRGADQFDLWAAMHSPENVAVFWVSHSAAPATSGVGLDSDGIIADWDGFDVSPAITEANPNLRFLGVVGCKSEQVVIKRLVDRGIRQSNPELEIQAFNSKVDARQGLYRMLIQAQPRLEAVRAGYAPVSCPERRGYELRVHRTFDRAGTPNPVAAQTGRETKFMPAVRLETAAGQTLGIFPAGNGTPQDLIVHLPPEAPGAKAFDLKLVENSGDNSEATSDEIEIGDLEFSEPWNGARWQVFANAEGRPLGTTSRVYRYRGQAALPTPAPVSYSPFVCAPMPAALQSTSAPRR